MSERVRIPLRFRHGVKGAFLVGVGWEGYLTRGKHCYIMLTMNSTNRNPLIRVTIETRKDLKIIAAYTGETMQEVVARLAKQERAKLQEGGKIDKKL
jgi:hypothetical protein